MKFLPSIISYFARHQSVKRNFRLLSRFILVLLLLIALYSVLFHSIMAFEGKSYSWITGIYWTLTVMTTLGFGDITFHTDLGRLFSIMVLLTGVIYLLTLLPFTFIKFFYAPWMEEEAKNRAPRELPPETADHVIVTAYDQVTSALIEKLKSHGLEYVLIVDDLKRALELYDSGIRVAVGDIDDPETYRKVRIERAALVVATNADEINTNIAFTVRELNERVPIITTADSPHSEDILYMAGSTKVIKLHDMLGRSLAAWTVGGDCRSTVISRFDELIIAESSAYGTPLVGKRLAESRIREEFGLSVVGIWERGHFTTVNPQSLIEANSVLVLAGSKKNMDAFDDVYSFYHVCRTSANPVLILGGGRVGQTISELFKERNIEYLIIEKNPRRVQEQEHYVFGDAADIRTLQKAWIENAPAALLTTHDDATNIYLTKYLRSLRPDMRILSRANLERNVSTLHRAGADFVMSYPTLGATAIFNFLRNEDIIMLAEGLNVFRLKAPKALVGKNLAQSRIRELTGCSVVAIKAEGAMKINPDPGEPIRENSELVIIGDIEGEKKLIQWR
ncbi:MAG: potassium transporter TrkA [Deltaproteobacteria bacterium CG23_combo_of_CG06-09_8_20_14_all_51_20]|nr:potassium channel protein [bacterium]OIP37393.1 MAG: potassium transporter TrkA [Desulfobacteraceae bacterium CG2_30_51_40]PIP45427.1 MAG: potassium transporter TrkA [Deltaproteobacteria bacterium CG23_combo_of_CG06-09_8_20_14_all_51_20]PIY21602.1 MAG: potassium transporter TrkA [Deltaproteobacteria bacterium CG_4_10_14_3_um_filter_51_14]PJB35787.1 MAG: potassium transporter TrkA [Deltaproteobacteria bacterium CG_4_9_14_3_um_filter_51_14]